MMRRRVIGRFKQSKQGGWEGEIETLTIKRRIRLVPNDNRMADNAPAFRVMLGWNEIGEAWEKQSRSDPPRDYLRVQIDDPLCLINALLFPDPEGLTAAMLLKQATRVLDAEQGRANRGFIQASDTYFHERGGKP
jgi:uncharacterized protein (DUF736 family)